MRMGGIAEMAATILATTQFIRVTTLYWKNYQVIGRT